MINKKIFIFILCCSLSQTYWTCVSGDKGSLLDAPMGISQDDGLKADIYIEDCVIEGMVTVSGDHAGVIRNDTLLTATCFVANLNNKTVKPELQIYISADEDMDVSTSSLIESAVVTIGPMERKKITLSGIIIGNDPPVGKNYAAVYVDPHNEDIDYSDENLSNNWSELVEIWVQ